mmetsp:Transcript_3571/g.4028  ORF Transcript_3571/g.4028 Transcript_3571/m.4028 type:complete len:223 (+) Transcript_3571:95-763(+)|eukprot:CAMPEP_0198253380 /NCGR_PEP_ID=MMETSP1447-20131203/3831_1 /TAXON_ID=420782 /ORGANISM="Chaetoceros dichaeta, Strain CCMP1751" /LENGTH=222 /DNA_ID=CAMNT_0043939043 /DNA_START=91 /DNA_END=755 /DNA_ORIENTATION=-
MGRNNEIQPVFSEDDSISAEVDARELVLKAKKAMKGSGAMEVFKQNLVEIMPILGLKQKIQEFYDPNDEMQTVVLENWTEEVLRFIAIKSIMGDSTEPCQLFPGFAVAAGWKALLVMPSVYRQVCFAMGNEHVFDHNPTDTASSKVQEKHRVKRYNATLRAYSNYYDQQPPALYWNFHTPPPRRILTLLDKVYAALEFCSSTPTPALTPEKGMSPDMPVNIT